MMMFFLRPNINEFRSASPHWARVDREEALRIHRDRPVVVVVSDNGFESATWFDASSAYFFGTGPYSYFQLRYFAYTGEVRKRAYPSAPSVRRMVEAEELVPLDQLIKEAIEALNWVEIEMAGEDGSPAKGLEYQVELPDGKIKKGRLDTLGRARIDSQMDGEFKVFFPGLDESGYVLEKG